MREVLEVLEKQHLFLEISLIDLQLTDGLKDGLYFICGG